LKIHLTLNNYRGTLKLKKCNPFWVAFFVLYICMVSQNLTN